MARRRRVLVIFVVLIALIGASCTGGSPGDQAARWGTARWDQASWGP